MIRHAVLALVLQAVLPVAEAGYPSAQQLLDKYAATRDKFRSFTSKSENNVEYSTTPNTSDPRFRSLRNHMKNTLRQDFRFDGKRANTRTHMWGRVVQGMPTVPEKDPYYTSKLRTEDGERGYGRANLTTDLGKVMIDMKPRAPAEMSLSRGYKGHEALGYLFGNDERVDVVLRRATRISVRDRMEKAGNSQCYVIDAVAKEGKYALWIDPEHGHNIAKAEVIRSGGDIDSKGKAVPDGDRYYTLLSNVQFKEIDGVWIPVEADIKYRWNLPNRYDYWENVHHKVTEFVVDPDHDALGSFASDDILNGAEVRITSVEGITYTWQDGKLVPNVNKAVIDEIDKMADELLADIRKTEPAVGPVVLTVSELLRKYAEAQVKLQFFIAKAESTIERTIEKTGAAGQLSWSENELCEFRFDGFRANHRSSTWDRSVSKDKPLYGSFLWDGESLIQYKRGLEPSGNMVFIRKSRSGRNAMICEQYKGAPLMGFCAGDYERIDSILSEAETTSLADKTEAIDGSQCHVINALTKRGRYKVWIDPQHGYNIAQIEVQRTQGDLIHDSERVTIGVSFALSNVRFEKIDGVWAPMEADVVQAQDDQAKVIKWHQKRTQMSLNPGHNALGSFVPDDIPDGTKVSIAGVFGVEHRWQSGRVVPEVK